MLKTEQRKNRLRGSILECASKIMNERGFQETNIGEIAEAVGITDPVIYQHFKGKEDLLFSVVEDQMQKYLAFLKEHLEGLQEPRSKLGKFIWAHLRYNDLNREYITLVVLECRTNRNFYMSNAYELIRENSRILMHILKEGVDKQVFRSDVDLKLVRDAIFGMLDFEVLTCLVTHEVENMIQGYEDCVQLVMHILLRRYYPSLSMGKRERILESALRIFAKKGYSEASISDIASLANVGDGTIYEYFKNKEDILLSISEDRMKLHIHNMKKAFTITDPIIKLERFILSHFQLYLGDQDFLMVYLMLILLNRRFYESRAYLSLKEYTEWFEGIVAEGIDLGYFDPETGVRVFRNMFLGAFTHMVLRWFFVKRETATDKTSEISKLVDLLSDGIKVRR